MPLFDQPHTPLLIAATVLSAVLTILSLKCAHLSENRFFAIVPGAAAFWSLAAVIETVFADPLVRVFGHGLKHIFIAFAPPAWFMYCLFSVARLRQLKSGRFLLLMIVPVVTTLLVAANDYHGLVFGEVQWRQTLHGQEIHRTFGPWLWIQLVYSCALVILGFFFLSGALIKAPAADRKQPALLLAAGVIPSTFTFLFFFYRWPSAHFDLTPFAASIGALVFVFGATRHGCADSASAARNAVFQDMRDGIIVLDTANRILDLNPSAANLLQRPMEKLLGQNAENAIPWWTTITPVADQPSAFDGCPPAAVKIRINDRRKIITATKTAFSIKEKTVGRIIMLRDVTAAQKAETAARISENRFRSLTENAPVIIFTLDINGIVRYTNQLCLNILGYRKDEVIGRAYHHFLAKNQNESHAQAFKRLVRGQESLAETNLYFIHKNGSQRLFNTSASVNVDPEGHIIGIIGTAKDITEERKLQLQLFQAQKMEAIGTLAGGIAHDFNNLLMGIQANISLMRMDTALDQTHNEKLTRIENQIQNGASLTRQLLGYARKGKYVIDAIDIRTLIIDSLNVIQRTNKGITTHYRLTDDPTFIEADRGQIELVLLNLFVNAVDAMPSGGELRVTTRVADAKSLTHLFNELKKGCFIELKVTDTGMGMDQRTMNRIFEPFFTTKEMGQGTGLGLASVYGVVKNHEGFIRVDSQLGKGTTFTLLFPLSECKKRPTPAPFRQPAPASRSGNKLMLVDDEPLVLDYCGEMIETLGYTVLRASGGHEAIRLFSENHARIDAVILDMIMPGMDGLSVYQALKKIDADLRVIVSSGYGNDARAETILADGPHACLKKPYTSIALAELLSSMLDEKPTSPPEPEMVSVIH